MRRHWNEVEDIKRRIREVCYLYRKTGLYSYVEEYFRLCAEAVRSGVKDYEVMAIIKRG